MGQLNEEPGVIRSQICALLLKIIDNIPESIAVVNKEHRIVMFNRCAEAMFGFDFYDVFGRNLTFLVANKDQDRVWSADEVYLNTKDGGEVQCSVEISHIKRCDSEYHVVVFKPKEQQDEYRRRTKAKLRIEVEDLINSTRTATIAR